MGNTFNGEVYEFPGIAVDKFNIPAYAYFLTHSHKDHLLGLINKSFCSRVYCTALTKQIIALDDKYKDVIPFLVVKEYNSPFEITTKTEKVTATLINSYHAPGSCMFLFEGNDKAALFTGDIRAEEWWVTSLIKNPFLFPYITRLKQLDQVYLDTTFAYRGEPYIHIMPNSDGIFAAIELLKPYPKDDEEVRFVFMDAVSGSEEAWFQIVNYFKGTLSGNQIIMKRIHMINEVSDVYTPIPSTRTQLPHFQVGLNVEEPAITITIKHTIDFNIVDYAGFCLPKLLSSVDTTAMQLLNETKKGTKIYQYQGRTWVLPVNGTELLPTNIKLMFSRHSSYQELRNFVNLFQPKLVYPCVESKSTWLNGFTIARTFGDLCTNEVHEHRYDIERFSAFGNPIAGIRDRQVCCIDRWSFSQCLEEEEFVAQYTRREIVPFKGTLQLQSGEDKSAEVSWRRGFRLQGIIAGRGEEKYKRLINYHREVKENRLFDIRSDGYSSSYDSDSYFEESYDTDIDSVSDVIEETKKL